MCVVVGSLLNKLLSRHYNIFVGMISFKSSTQSEGERQILINSMSRQLATFLPETEKKNRISPKSHEIYSTSNYDNEIEETFDHMLCYSLERLKQQRKI
jgi:hypothetical protein